MAAITLCCNLKASEWDEIMKDLTVHHRNITAVIAVCYCYPGLPTLRTGMPLCLCTCMHVADVQRGLYFGKDDTECG